MESFLREYATRSMRSVLPAAPHGSLLHYNGVNYNNNNNNNKYNNNHNNNNSYYNNIEYYISWNGSQYLEDPNLNETFASESPTKLAQSENFSDDASDNFQLLSDSARLNASSIYEGLFNFNQSFSCDGESLAVSSVNDSSGVPVGVEEDDASALSSVYFKTAVYLLYIPIFIFALLGNGTVCYIVQSTPRMRTVTNFFIANLAVGDILMSLFCVPFSFVSIFILGYWPFGIALCYLVNYSQAVSVLVSAYTLVAISLDRYIAIMWPLRPRITKRYAKFIIAGVWAIALVTAFPIPIVSKLSQPDLWHVQCQRYICREEWPSNEQYYYYTLALFTLQFVLPLAVLIFTYTRIALAVWGKRPPGEAENSRDQRMARSKRKMIKMMVMVVIVFTMCWLPFNILVLLLNDEEFGMWPPLPYFWFAFHWLAMSHSCYNPIIYCYMNARFRGGFLQIMYRVPGLRRCCCLRRCLRTRDRSYEPTGTDDAFHLQRVNTCTTYISTRRKLRANSMQVSQFSCAETTVLR